MIYLLITACLVHKTAFVGVVDYAGDTQCTIVLEDKDSSMIIVNSEVCNNSKEGDVIYFYTKKGGGND